MKTAALLSLLCFWLVWDFDGSYRDRVEYSTDGGTSWQELPGPYPLDYTTQSYRVNVCERSGQLFRIARWWGIPWI